MYPRRASLRFAVLIIVVRLSLERMDVAMKAYFVGSDKVIEPVVPVVAKEVPDASNVTRSVEKPFFIFLTERSLRSLIRIQHL